MPIYEYACDDCGAQFEKLVRRSAESEGVLCPSCGQDHLTTRYSTFAAHAGGAKASSEPTTGCGGGMCGTNMSESGMCEGGMCGMNMN